MILVGIDDTDTADSPGTNQQARAIVAALEDIAACRFVLRHQLLFDPRVPYTSKNGSASIELAPRRARWDLEEVADRCRRVLRDRFAHGSDPGLCVIDAGALTETVRERVVEWGRACQSRLVTQAEARALAAAEGILLEGLGGTEGGVIGALAAVGLAATRDDGRVVVHGEFPELGGMQPVDVLASRGIEVREHTSGRLVDAGWVDVGKKLRANIRSGRVVLFVEADGGWKARKVN